MQGEQQGLPNRRPIFYAQAAKHFHPSNVIFYTI
jgi:hypothetical protein